MAFQQPTRQAIQRPLRDESEDRDDNGVTTAAVAPVSTEESQTWVLFSPTAETATTTDTPSVLGSVPASSEQTAGRSRISDLGSLRSVGRSNYASSYAQSPFAPPGNLHLSLLSSSLSHTNDNDDAVMSEDSRQDAEDDAELDSLDSHLPDFRPTHGQAQIESQERDQPPPHMTATARTTVNLPTHDGLGSFRLGNAVGMSAAVQEHLYAFEQFNPRRVMKRRRESVDLAEFQEQGDPELAEDIERTRRIEAWRWEHSRVLLEEIQKETRRRRGSDLSARRTQSVPASGAAAATERNTVSEDAVIAEVSGDWHEQEEDERLLRQLRGAAGDEEAEQEGLWSRITRKFMVEVMGLDDRILSLLFGEALADGEEQDEEMDLSSTPRASNPLLASSMGTDIAADGLRDDDSTSSWQLRMLERIAKELGLFVHSHMSAHPGAFSTFVRVQQMPLPYAGLPVIPEAATLPSRETAVGNDSETNERCNRDKVAEDTMPTGTTSSLPPFKPTIYQAQPIDIPGQAAESTPALAPSAAATPTATATPAASTFTQEEWEQDLDIKLVFRYLRSRFFSGASSSSNHAHRHHHNHHGLHHSLGSSSSTASMQDAAAKAARVRQHHPLVGRGAGRQAGDRRPMSAYRNMNTAAVAAPPSPIAGMRHPHGTATSCASQSTRRSARRSSISSRHSSRHYWDIGGSIGTGSMIASAGPMGSWGEV